MGEGKPLPSFCLPESGMSPLSGILYERIVPFSAKLLFESGEKPCFG